MISCQVSMIAEICKRHPKICETVLWYNTTIQNSFRNQRLIPLTIGVKKASGLKSCQGRFELVTEICCFVNYSIVTD